MAKNRVLMVAGFLEARLHEAGLNISKIVLFGSQARGASTADSDIDIAVVSTDFRGKDVFERVALVKDAEIATIRKYMMPLDIVLLTPEEFRSGSSIIAGYARSGKEYRAA